MTRRIPQTQLRIERLEARSMLAADTPFEELQLFSVPLSPGETSPEDLSSEVNSVTSEALATAEPTSIDSEENAGPASQTFNAEDVDEVLLASANFLLLSHSEPSAAIQRDDLFADESLLDELFDHDRLNVDLEVFDRRTQPYSTPIATDNQTHLDDSKPESPSAEEVQLLDDKQDANPLLAPSGSR